MKRTPLLTALAALLLLAGCKNGNKSGLAIPKDAAVVFHINAASLSSKLSWDEIKKTTWFRDLREKSQGNDGGDSLAQKLLDDPKASGVDVSSDFAYFIEKRGQGGYNLFEGSLKDAAAFEALVKKMSKQDKVEKSDDWSNITVSPSTVVSWNSSKFAVINDLPIGAINPMQGKAMTGTRFTADSLKAFVKAVMTQDNDQSLFNDDRFASVMKEPGDMHFWMNAGRLYSEMAGMMSMMKIGSLFEDNVTGGAINFEDGKIATRMKQFYGKEMQRVMEKWKFKKLDAAVLNRIPSDNVIGVFAMNTDPAGIKELFKAMGLDGMANMYLQRMNLSLDEILGATKGQFVMALSDLQMKDTTLKIEGASGVSSFQTRQPDMSFLLATDVAQKPTFDKLLNTFKDAIPTGTATYQLNNDWFVIGNKPAAVNGFAGGANVKHAFTDKLTGHYCGFYLDVQRLLKTNFGNDAFTKSLLAESAAVWQDVVMVANDYKDGVATAEMTINFVDGKTNSLKQLNQYIEKMNAASKANKMAMGNGLPGVQVDTATEVAPGVLPPKAVEEPAH